MKELGLDLPFSTKLLELETGHSHVGHCQGYSNFWCLWVTLEEEELFWATH